MSKYKNTEHLKRLVKARGLTCELCGKPVVCISLIPICNRIKQSPKWLTYRTEEGTIETALIASVEHVKRRADGGGNKLKNMKVSCISCNLQANRKYHPKKKGCKYCNRPFKEGGGRHKKHKKYCNECWNKKQKEWEAKREEVLRKYGKLNG